MFGMFGMGGFGMMPMGMMMGGAPIVGMVLPIRPSFRDPQTTNSIDFFHRLCNHCACTITSAHLDHRGIVGGRISVSAAAMLSLRAKALADWTKLQT